MLVDCQTSSLDYGPSARDARIETSTRLLADTRPEFSASLPPPRSQLAAIAAVPTTFAFLIYLAPEEGRSLTLFAVSLAFICVAALRLAALFRPPPKSSSPPPVSPTTLPQYTLLVPLYREAEIVPETVAAMSALCYPKDKLQILFLFEEDDHSTRNAFIATPHPPYMKAVVVPEGAPRTKPRALCFGMFFAKGDYIAVFDAEDLPEPTQLLNVLTHFRAHPDTGCVQARLNIDNREENSALFDALLPTLEHWQLPIPLGGTSNNFPRAVLESIGGWDPYNVTEDADLGIRLARLGWHVRTDPSTTWEEAPASPMPWLSQRTRWIKGWMQTYLVHMRYPARTWQELGTKSFFGLQLLMAAQVFSPLVHPRALALMLSHVLSVLTRHQGQSTTLELALMAFAVFNLLVGYASGMALGMSAARKRGLKNLWPYVLTLPLYWLLISIAAHRALYQMITRPFHWEKTAHRGRGLKPG